MAHAQKPDFFFRRNGRAHLNRRGCQFSLLLAAEVCASAVVMLDTPCSQIVWRVLTCYTVCQNALYYCFVLIISLMFTALCLLQLYSLYYAGQWTKFKNSVCTRLPWNQSSRWFMVQHLRPSAIAGPVRWQWIFCILLRNFTLRYADTLNQAASGTRRPAFIWRVRWQQWCLISLLFLVCNH
jgi:hypothetical protein